MTEASPPDTEQVRYAFRLGWVLAELRGRYRPDRFGEREPTNERTFLRSDFELPLSNERSQTEIRIELFDAVTDLSDALKLAPCDEDGHPFLGLIKPLLEAMEAAGADREGLWKGSRQQPGLAYHFFKWDAQNQDELVLGATQAAAVLLTVGAYLLASGAGHTGATAAISVLGALGLTSAGLYAKAKTQITSLLTNLTQQVQRERIRQAANLCPPTTPSPETQNTTPTPCPSDPQNTGRGRKPRDPDPA